MVPAAIVIQARRLLGDAATESWTDAELFFHLNQAAIDIQAQTSLAKIRRSFSLTANGREVALDDEIAEPVWRGLIYREGEEHRILRYDPPEKFFASRTITSEIPERWTFMDDERQILLWPTPDTAAPASTLSGAHNATVTTFTLVSVANFADHGRALVNSEVIEWVGRDATANTLTGVTRGLEGTTAASHSDTNAITERNIMVYGLRRIREMEWRKLYTAGTVTTVNGNVAVTGASTAWNIAENARVGDYFGTRPTVQEMPRQFFRITAIGGATSLTLAQTWPFAGGGGTEQHVISDPFIFPNYADTALLSYVLWKTVQSQASRTAQALSDRYGRDYGVAISAIKKRLAKSDEILIPTRAVGRHREHEAFLSGDHPTVRLL